MSTSAIHGERASAAVRVGSKGTPTTPWALARALSPTVPGSRLFLAITVIRVVLVVPVALSGSPLLASLALTTFIVWDVYDGNVARRFTVDSPLRRMVDAYTDRTFILAVVGVLTIRDARWWPAFALLLVRDGLMWAGLLRVFRSRGACLLGGRPNKQAALLWAAWAYGTFWLGFSVGTVLLAGAWVVLKFGVALNMVRSVGETRCDPPRVLVVDRWGASLSTAATGSAVPSAGR